MEAAAAPTAVLAPVSAVGPDGDAAPKKKESAPQADKELAAKAKAVAPERAKCPD